jgi:ferredoxin
MITEKIVEKLTNALDIIAVNRAKCLRMRFYENRCSSCADICPSGAINIEGGVKIEKEACTECMLCVSACASDGLSIDSAKFYPAIAALRKVPEPVLGCTVKPEAQAHARTFCFGYMSEEHIVALIYFMRGPLQINLTECAGCKNAVIVEALEKRLKAVGEKTSLKISEMIQPVRNKRDLRFVEVSLDRRGFFEALKKSAFVGVAGLLEKKSDDAKIQSYSGGKTAPSKREMLNQVFSGLPEESRKGLSENYYYDLTVNESCDHCASCGAMCPTGAIKVETGESTAELLFNSSLCTGCGLCASFCLNRSLRVEKGFAGTDPFEFSLKLRSDRAVTEDSADVT